MLGPVRVKVKIRFVGLSSGREEGETARVMSGRSSLLMVATTGEEVPMEYPEPVARESATVSLGSILESAVGSTVSVAVEELAAKVMDLTEPAVGMPV